MELDVGFDLSGNENVRDSSDGVDRSGAGLEDFLGGGKNFSLVIGFDRDEFDSIGDFIVDESGLECLSGGGGLHGD